MKLTHLLLFTSAICCLPLKANTATQQFLNSFVENKDYLGLRVYLRRLSRSKKLDVAGWVDTRSFILNNISKTGFDILYMWDKTVPKALETKRVLAVRKYLGNADALLLQKNFTEAFSTYQKVAQSLKADLDGKDVGVAQSASALYPFVIEGMGRSLYGMGRFAESAEVFGWIGPTYPRYRRTLFESMWASFRGGRADEALGKIAAQFSSFFTEFHYPEAYLMEAYVYKKLCRRDELEKVIQKMRNLREEVRSGRFTWRDWMKSDIEGFVLGKIMEAKPVELMNTVKDSERINERKAIERALSKAFDAEKTLWSSNMDSAIAYAQLSTGKVSLLKPIEKLPSRAELFQMKLEIWPAEDREEWIDELGSHRFVGESKCATR